MEDIKRIEQEPHHNCETIGEQLAHAAGYQKARSKDTDLIKDMLPYMQHTQECQSHLLEYEEVGGAIAGRWGPCSCGLSELLQRINERSK